MDRRYRLGVVGVALLLLAGASAYVFLAGQNTHDSGAYLDVEVINETGSEEETAAANETVAFEQLSPAQQELFRRADNTTGLVEIPPDTDYVVFVDNHYVRYQNRTYRVAVAVGD